MYIDLGTLEESQCEAALTDGIIVHQSDRSRRRYGYWPNGRLRFIANEERYHARWRWRGWALFYSRSGNRKLDISFVNERDEKPYSSARVLDAVSDTPLWTLSIEDDGSIGVFSRVDSSGKTVESFHYQDPMGTLKQGRLPRDVEEMHEASMQLFHRAF